MPASGEVRGLSVPASGEVRGLSVPASGEVKLELDRLESAFVVLSKKAAPAPAQAAPRSIAISSPWTVEFAESAGHPAFKKEFASLTDWARSEDPQVRYYSGKATYSNTFNVARGDLGSSRITLDLGEVIALASVKVNGKEAGGAWTFPYSLKIGDLVEEGENTLEITVWNNWRNRLVADEKLPVEERLTWTNIQPWSADSDLQPSGLLGPVAVRLE